MIRTWLVTFAQDTKVHILLLLIVADFVLGAGAALKGGTFRLSYVADTLKRDVLGKFLPYCAVYILDIVVHGGSDIVIPGLDFGIIAGSAYVLAVAAMSGSIMNSIAKFGIPLPAALAADEAADTTGDAPITAPPTVRLTGHVAH